MTNEITSRRVVLRKASEIRDDVPEWAWDYDDRGRIARGTVALLAGRPGAGKSTAARWFAAQVTTGTLPGCWLGRPTNVAYIAREEAVEYVVKPSLRAHNADLDRVFFPETIIISEAAGEEVRPVGIADMDALTAELVAADVQMIVVDPLMALAGAKVDVNRNNEVRELVEPWRTLAERINGVVLGVAHLNKAGNGDVVAGINGSSAFGEVARAVFGFAKDPTAEDGARVLSQEKNSLGDEDLALRYRIDSTTIYTDSGKSAAMGRFLILGDSDRTVADVLREASRPESGGDKYAEIIEWLREFLGGDAIEANEIYKAGDAAGYSKDQLKRAKAKAGIVATRPVNPGPWCWQQAPSTEQQGATREELLSAPCEVREGFAGSREQSAVSTREALPASAIPGDTTGTTPGLTPRVLKILGAQG